MTTLHTILFTQFDREELFILRQALIEEAFTVYLVSLKDTDIPDATGQKFKPDYYLSQLPTAVENLYIASQKYNDLTVLLEPRLHALIRNTLNTGGHVFMPQHLAQQFWQLPSLGKPIAIANNSSQVQQALTRLYSISPSAYSLIHFA